MSGLASPVSASTDRAAYLVLLAAIVTSVLILVPKAWIGVAMLLGATLVLYIFATTLDGKSEIPLLFWAAVFPLGYYFASFPRERAIITLDRIIVVVVFLGTLLAPRSKMTRLPVFLRRAGIAWGCFLLAAFVSLGNTTDLLASGRVVLDGFLLPAVLGWCVVRNFDARRHLAPLHVMVCVMAIYVAVIGAMEMATGTDLLPLPGAGLYFAGSIMRPNGPFLSDNSFGLIGLITFFFILFLRRAISRPIPWWQRLVHISGAASALATALMPLFRSVGITLLIILLLDMYFKKDTGRAVVKLALILSAFGALAILSTKAQDAYQDRMDTANVYTRIAEMKQIVELVKLHTLTGLGVANFENAAKARAQSVGIYKGYEAADYPHNNLGAILTETGLMGFTPYVAAQIFLFMCFMRLKSSEPEGSRHVWTCFLYVFLSYWVNGMSLTAGYYSDLNLWYVFVLMVLYKYAITESRAPSVLRTPGLSFGSADGMLANVAR